MIVIRHHNFNENLSNSIKKLNGTWDKDEQGYIVPEVVQDKAKKKVLLLDCKFLKVHSKELQKAKNGM